MVNVLVAPGVTRPCWLPPHNGPDHVTRYLEKPWPWTDCTCVCHDGNPTVDHNPQCVHTSTAQPDAEPHQEVAA